MNNWFLFKNLYSILHSGYKVFGNLNHIKKSMNFIALNTKYPTKWPLQTNNASALFRITLLWGKCHLFKSVAKYILGPLYLKSSVQVLPALFNTYQRFAHGRHHCQMGSTCTSLNAGLMVRQIIIWNIKKYGVIKILMYEVIKLL